MNDCVVLAALGPKLRRTLELLSVPFYMRVSVKAARDGEALCPCGSATDTFVLLSTENGSESRYPTHKIASIAFHAYKQAYMDTFLSTDAECVHVHV